MKKYIFSEELGNIDEKYIKEVLQYDDSSRSERSYKMRIFMNFTAAAACAALVLGAGAFAFGRSGSDSASLKSLPDETQADVTEALNADDPAAEPVKVIEVEKSYNDRIADGEDVSIETYIGIPYRISSEKYSVVGDFTYTLQSVGVSDRLPEGITTDDLEVSVGPVMEYSEDGVKTYSTEDGKSALDIREFLDESGVYSGPGNGYKWVFLTLDVTNNSDREVVKFINTLRLAGGECKTYSLSPPGINGEAVDADFREYEYFQELCYHNARYFDYDSCYEMTFANVSDEKRAEVEKKAIEKYGSVENYLREKFAGMTHFDPGETKTVTVGFPVNTYFVYGDLFLELNPSGALNPEVIEYIPLK